MPFWSRGRCLAALVACLLLAAIGDGAVADPAANDAQNAGLYSAQLGWSRGKFVKDAGGKVFGRWGGSVVSPCISEPPVTYVDKATVTELRTVGKCQDGDDVVMLSRRPAPAPLAVGACSFDYVTIDGMIPGVFQEVTTTVAANPEALAAMRKSLPDLRRIFATKAGGGFVALVGGADLPTDYSRYAASQAVKALTTTAELAKKTAPAGSNFTYVIAKDLPISAFATMDYSDGGTQRRTVAMDVIANKKCLFSIKFSGNREPNDDAKWQSIQQEFQRIRRVIAQQEGPVAFAGER